MSVGGRLIVVDSKEENEFVNTIMIHNGTWVGYSRTSLQADWSNIYGDFVYENFADDIKENDYGYGVTWGNEWYATDNDNEYRHYIVEFGPVTTSELASTVDLVFADASTCN